MTAENSALLPCLDQLMSCKVGLNNIRQGAWMEEGFIVFGNLFGNNDHACLVLSVPQKSRSQPQMMNSTNAKVSNAEKYE